MNCYLRPLVKEDAQVSYNWRNDSEIWKHTGSRPNILITPQIEETWILEAIARKNEIRFAICIEETNEYIGNVQLTKITEIDAEFHIFIGMKQFWGMNLGQKATLLMLNYGFEKLKLKAIYLFVSKKNGAAISIYKKCGFISIEENNDNNYKMIIKNTKYI